MTGFRPTRVPHRWPPDDTWTFQELLAELNFWRNYSALRPYSARRPDVEIPAQRPPVDPRRAATDARWDALCEAAFSRYRPRRPGHR